MRKDFPLSSQELYDNLMIMYQDMVDILGAEVMDNGLYSGIYHHLEASGESYMLGNQNVAPIPIIHNNNRTIGISNIQNFDEMISYLKFDWIYRKDKGLIK